MVILLQVTIQKQVKTFENPTNNFCLDMKKLFEHKKLCDFTFIVDGEEMKVNKAVLGGEEF